MSKQRIIQWRSQHLEVDPIQKKLVEPKVDNEPQYYDEDGGDEDFEGKRFTMTAFGMHEIDDSFHPLREFQVWVGDTNMPITKKDAKNVCRVPGVEMFKPIGRYKFIVAVGKLFDFSEVRIDIEYVLCNKNKIDVLIRHAENEAIKAALTDIKKKIGNSEIWAAYIFPNGQYDLTIGTDPNYPIKVTQYNMAKQFSRGLIIGS